MNLNDVNFCPNSKTSKKRMKACHKFTSIFYHSQRFCLSFVSGLFYVQKYDFDFLETGLIYWNRDRKRILEFRAS